MENAFEELDRSLRYIIDRARESPDFDNINAYNCMPGWVLSVMGWGLTSTAVQQLRDLGITRLGELLNEPA